MPRVPQLREHVEARDPARLQKFLTTGGRNVSVEIHAQVYRSDRVTNVDLQRLVLFLLSEMLVNQPQYSKKVCSFKLLQCVWASVLCEKVRGTVAFSVFVSWLRSHPPLWSSAVLGLVQLRSGASWSFHGAGGRSSTGLPCRCNCTTFSVFFSSVHFDEYVHLSINMYGCQWQSLSISLCLPLFLFLPLSLVLLYMRECSCPKRG